VSETRDRARSDCLTDLVVPCLGRSCLALNCLVCCLVVSRDGGCVMDVLDGEDEMSLQQKKLADR